MTFWGFLGGSVVKDLPANAGDLGLIPGLGRSQPGRLQSMGSQRGGHDWATSFHFTSFFEEEMASTPVFLSGKSHGQRSLVGYSPWGHKTVGHDSAYTHGLFKYLTSSPPPPLCSIEDTQTPTRFFFWDTSLPSSLPTFRIKSLFLASAPCLPILTCCAQRARTQ